MKHLADQRVIVVAVSVPALTGIGWAAAILATTDRFEPLIVLGTISGIGMVIGGPRPYLSSVVARRSAKGSEDRARYMQQAVRSGTALMLAAALFVSSMCVLYQDAALSFFLGFCALGAVAFEKPCHKALEGTKARETSVAQALTAFIERFLPTPRRADQTAAPESDGGRLVGDPLTVISLVGCLVLLIATTSAAAIIK